MANKKFYDIVTWWRTLMQVSDNSLRRCSCLTHSWKSLEASISFFRSSVFRRLPRKSISSWRRCYKTFREPFLNGKTKYSLSPGNKKFSSATFDIANLIYFFTNPATLMRRSTVFPHSVSIPWNFTSLTLMLRQNKLTCLSLEIIF